MARAFLGLGGNLATAAGDARATLLAAIGVIAATPGIVRVRRSRIYRSEPVGPAQPEYANAVIEIETGLSPEDLLELARELEARFGRVRTGAVPLGPRTLDVDLLLHGSETRAGSGTELVLPHPRLHERRFVLVPLAEIAPERVHPTLGLSMAELLERTTDRHWVTPWDSAEAAGVGASSSVATFVAAATPADGSVLADAKSGVRGNVAAGVSPAAAAGRAGRV